MKLSEGIQGRFPQQTVYNLYYVALINCLNLPFCFYLNEMLSNPRVSSVKFANDDEFVDRRQTFAIIWSYFEKKNDVTFFACIQ